MAFGLLAALAFIQPSFAADQIDVEWDFVETDTLGWSASGDLTGVSVTGGSLRAQTTGTDPYLTGPEIGVSASSKHYIVVQMKQKLTSGRIDRFPSSEARIYFTTLAAPAMSDARSFPFVVYGVGYWKDYIIQVGDHADWTGTITRIRLDPCVLNGVSLEVDKIELKQDLTVPEFILEHDWSVVDGETSRDLSPTVKVFDYYDNVTGIAQAQFYYQSVVDGHAGAWIEDGTPDTTLEDGFPHSYPTLSEGTYNFSAKLTDNAGNASWLRRDDQIISDVLLDASADTVIQVDVFQDQGQVNRKVFGNNCHTSMIHNIVSATGEWPTAFADLVYEMGLPFHRFHFGESSDLYSWKDSVWIEGYRPDLIPDPCSGDTTTNLGPAKFGMEEYLARCEEKGTVPYFTLEYRCSLDTQVAFETAVQDAADLVEYLNSPAGVNINGGTDWAQIRADNGHPEPYDVEYIELGNEVWGWDKCGTKES